MATETRRPRRRGAGGESNRVRRCTSEAPRRRRQESEQACGKVREVGACLRQNDGVSTRCRGQIITRIFPFLAKAIPVWSGGWMRQGRQTDSSAIPQVATVSQPAYRAATFNWLDVRRARNARPQPQVRTKSALHRSRVRRRPDCAIAGVAIHSYGAQAECRDRRAGVTRRTSDNNQQPGRLGAMPSSAANVPARNPQ